MSLRFESPAFDDGYPIPSRYTCDGKNISPPLAWYDIPPETQSLAIMLDDPDVSRGIWTHWLIYNIPPSVTQLSEGVPTHEAIDLNIRQAKNDFGHIGYGGPCPAKGRHRYFLHLFALDNQFVLPPAARRTEFMNAIEGHVLDTGILSFSFRRNHKPR